MNEHLPTRDRQATRLDETHHYERKEQVRRGIMILVAPGAVPAWHIFDYTGCVGR